MDASTPVPNASQQKQQQYHRRRRLQQKRRQQYEQQVQRHKQQQQLQQWGRSQQHWRQQHEQQLQELKQQPPPDDTLQRKATGIIDGVINTLSELVDRVDAFQGHATADREYRKLKEMMTRQLQLLDAVETGGQDSICKQRREAVYLTIGVRELLDMKVQYNQQEGDGDSSSSSTS